MTYAITAKSSLYRDPAGTAESLSGAEPNFGGIGATTVTAATATTLGGSVTVDQGTGWYDINACVSLQTINTPAAALAFVRCLCRIFKNGSNMSPPIEGWATRSFGPDTGVNSTPFGTEIRGMAQLNDGDVIAVNVLPQYLQPEVSSLTDFTAEVDHLSVVRRA